MKNPISFFNWGEISYQAASEKQIKIVNEVSQEQNPKDTIIFCHHPPVITLGRSQKNLKPSELNKEWKGEIALSSRGGQATYHGPEQQVIYPIISLKKLRQKLRPCHIKDYLNILEQTTVDCLKEWNVSAKTSREAFPSGSYENVSSTDSEKKLLTTGVWVNSKKIASIGIAIRKWITYHGIAINLTASKNWNYFNPCGFEPHMMTSLEEVLEKKIDRQEFQKVFSQKITQNLS